MTRSRWLLVSLLALAPLVAPVLPAPRAPAPPDDGDARPRGPVHDPGDWFYAQRADRDGRLPQARYVAALQQVRAELAIAGAFGARAATGSLVWQPVGPTNVGGRVTAITVAGDGSLWLGSANGGVWKSTDAGADWTCVTDGQPFYSIGAVAADPSHPSTVYVGTGEANGSVDSYDGDGLWRTTDGGATWANLGLTTTARIAKVLVDPANPAHVLVAAMGEQFSTSPDRGLYQTLDGGTTWSRVLYLSDSTGVTDVVMNPVHPDTMFCATWERVRRLTYRRTSGPESGVWRSTDRGSTWARLTTGLPAPNDSLGRIALAVAPTRPSTVYAQITTGANLGYIGLGFYRSTDGGNTWARRDAGSPYTDNFGGFGWYFGAMGVDPNNADHVWTLGVSLYASTDGGATWASVNGSLHVDQHAIWIDPANSLHVYEGNDGGFYSTTTGTNWTHAANLPISQFYDGDVSAANAGAVYGGLQDNSTIMTTTGPGGWFVIQGGDGFHVLVDPVNPNIVFDEYQYCSGGGGFFRSTNGGPSQGYTSGWNGYDRFGWDTPIAMNPLDDNVLLAGSQYVYRSTDNGRTWGYLSPDLSTDPVSQLVYGCITTLSISPADTTVYYAGTDDGKVWRSTNRGAAWSDITAGLPSRWVTRVVADPADPQGVYVTLSGFTVDQQAALVYHSTNRGTTWTNISGNLPNFPGDALVVDPLDPQTLYLGTDLGVWISRNRGATWYPLGAGLPLQAVLDLKLHAATRQLFAFTHGRSAWKLDLTALPAAVPAAAPPALALAPPWPNPAREDVRLSLSLPRAATAEVSIYDVIGRRVSTLHEGELEAGTHALTWDRRDARGARARAGVYFVRAVAGGATRVQRLVLAD